MSSPLNDDYVFVVTDPEATEAPFTKNQTFVRSDSTLLGGKSTSSYRLSGSKDPQDGFRFASNVPATGAPEDTKKKLFFGSRRTFSVVSALNLQPRLASAHVDVNFRIPPSIDTDELNEFIDAVIEMMNHDDFRNKFVHASWT